MPSASVIVLSIDRLGAGWLGPYGNTWLETPSFNRLAAQAAVVETAIADSPDLATACRSWWSGRHALEPDEPQAASLPTECMAGGGSSILLTDDPQLALHPGAAGFSQRRVLPTASVSRAADEIEQTELFRFFDAARAIVSDPQRPSLIWLHARGMAGPWDAPFELRSQFADEDDPEPPDFVAPPERTLPPDHDPDELLGIVHAYAGQVALADLCLGLLLAACDEHPLAGQTLFACAAPRGYPLGEHLRIGPCDQALYGELLHVPMIVRVPEHAGPSRLESIVQFSELPRLIRDFCQWNGGAALPGSRLLREIETGDCGPPAAAYSFAAGQRSIRTPAWFMRQWPEAEGAQTALFTKPDDRWEANEIASHGGDAAELLARQLDAFTALAREGRLDQLPPLPDLLVNRWR